MGPRRKDLLNQDVNSPDRNVNPIEEEDENLDEREILSPEDDDDEVDEDDEE